MSAPTPSAAAMKLLGAILGRRAWSSDDLDIACGIDAYVAAQVAAARRAERERCQHRLAQVYRDHLSGPEAVGRGISLCESALRALGDADGT